MIPRAALSCALAAFASAATLAEAPTQPAAEILEAAFDARFSCALTGVIEIETRKGDAAARTRRMEVAMKSIDSRLHTYTIFREPQYVRGMALLAIESGVAGESEERFVYLPSLRKIRARDRGEGLCDPRDALLQDRRAGALQTAPHGARRHPRAREVPHSQTNPGDRLARDEATDSGALT